MGTSIVIRIARRWRSHRCSQCERLSALTLTHRDAQSPRFGISQLLPTTSKACRSRTRNWRRSKRLQVDGTRASLSCSHSKEAVSHRLAPRRGMRRCCAEAGLTEEQAMKQT
ncbi:uncharacterized protein MYCFIDRAFT_210600 [Pseudocercospora fijiensis CIRAD86]|uniref:Uncharacterized protein n=1 Tax=Pseudocercospora fijiensis (strain CIRAD86) TaxID=383855 RepID=M3BBW8_PSEFD|nr:uncharacterized protein MYCFIDRAFT_210600 [Pseudocercospora fijiensis CIRAD86]EME86752.1 hypothetical protein MYCFIDRAFT_210600 [Pseudocercospora fijiensis CIRAD86]